MKVIFCFTVTPTTLVKHLWSTTHHSPPSQNPLKWSKRTECWFGKEQSLILYCCLIAGPSCNISFKSQKKATKQKKMSEWKKKGKLILRIECKLGDAALRCSPQHLGVWAAPQLGRIFPEEMLRERRRSGTCLWRKPGSAAGLGTRSSSAPAPASCWDWAVRVVLVVRAPADLGSRSGKPGLAVFQGWLD